MRQREEERVADENGDSVYSGYLGLLILKGARLQRQQNEMNRVLDEMQAHGMEV